MEEDRSQLANSHISALEQEEIDLFNRILNLPEKSRHRLMGLVELAEALEANYLERLDQLDSEKVKS